MTTFSKIRNAATLARDFRREADRLPRGSEARMEKLVLAREWEVEAEYIAGRIDEATYWVERRECADAQAFALPTAVVEMVATDGPGLVLVDEIPL